MPAVESEIATTLVALLAQDLESRETSVTSTLDSDRKILGLEAPGL